MRVPAGASVEPLAVAILSGTDPMVKVKEIVVDPEVRLTGLSPERSLLGVHDQFPEESAVAETVWEPTVPVTWALAVVIPVKAGFDDVTQN